MDADRQKEADWSSLTPEEKRRELFNRQKATLMTLLERKAITREQYEKSYRVLAEQMGFDVSYRQKKSDSNMK